MKKRMMVLAGLCVLGTVVSAQAATVVLQNGLGGYSGTADAYVQSSSPDALLGSSNWLATQTGGPQGYRYVLIRFDLSPIPAGQTIESATLSLYCGGTKSGNTAWIWGHRMLRSWDEGDVSWNNYDAGARWDSRPDGAGGASGSGDHSSSYASGFDPGGTAATPGYWTEVTVTTEVLNWYNNVYENWGWWIHESSDREPEFLSSNLGGGTYDERRPKLTITYTPEPTMVGLLALGGLMLRSRNRR
jgi:hypothetical protein